VNRVVSKKILFHDKYLLFAVLALIGIGLLMVASASMAISERRFDESFHYLFRQSIYLILGVCVALLVLHIKVEFWEKVSGLLLLLGIFLLILVLVPGLGKAVNGSSRWLELGGLTLQVSEFVKLAVIVYLAGYLVRHQREVRTEVSGFLKPMLLLGIISFLLLLEPDFGAIVVIMATTLGMMYLAGARLWQFGVLLLMVLISLWILAVSSPYRVLRLTSFLNPWNNQFDSGYQLTQSLIAFGRGGLFGVGLGGSIQKLFYLPEAHTDFLFAVLGEELGLIGILVIIGLYYLLIVRALLIGKRALLANHYVSAYIAYGIAIWLGMQAFINMGVNSGLLPTKGLTLPLISYGGSSLLIISTAIALLFRIERETRN
jgi:cell division protein FtsW